MKVKKRERAAILKKEAQERERNRQAELAIKMENERQKKTALDLLAKEVPRSDKVNLGSMQEYDKLDGFHEKPMGADQMLREMREEQKEYEEKKVVTRVEELQAIET